MPGAGEHKQPGYAELFFAFKAFKVRRRGLHEPTGPGLAAGGLEGIRGLPAG